MKLLPARQPVALVPAIALLLLVWISTALGSGITTATVEEARTRVNTDTSLAQTDRDTLLEKLDDAQNQLQRAAEFRSRTARLRAEQQQAPQRAAEFEQRLRDAQASPADPAAGISADDSAGALESDLTLATAQRQSLVERRNQLLEEVETQSRRRAEIRQRIVELQGIIGDAPLGETAAAAGTAEEVTRVHGLARKQAAAADGAVQR